MDAVLSAGARVDAVAFPSIGANRKTTELLNTQITISRPSDRVPATVGHHFSLTKAVARFVWNISGNDRLADIAFYDRGAEKFSDDGLAIPGSNFGQRIRSPRPGVDQVTSIIDRIRVDPTTRRASASVYFPDDVNRHSKDIPCVIAVTYNLRDDGLHATTLMRSNNAYRIVPYNLFELSLLAEIIASELGSPLASLTHFAVSLHIYDDDSESAARLLSLPAHENQFAPPALAPSSDALAQAAILSRLECELRYLARGLTASKALTLHEQASSELNWYWFGYFAILLHGVAVQASLPDVARHIRSSIDPYFIAHVDHDTEHLRS